jgi:hypothetical protein
VTHADLPAAVGRFLREEIASFERLAVLLLVRRQATRWWSAHAVALDLLMPVDAAQAHLEHLSARNLLDIRLSESVIYCYKPGTDDLAQLVDRVADAHDHHLDAVVNAFTFRPGESIRLFADAFRLRRGPRDG